MRCRLAGLLLLALTAPGAVGSSVEAAIRGTAGAHIADDGRFAPGLQVKWGAGAMVELISAIGLGAGMAVEFESTLASPLVDLVSYRGYTGTRLTVYAVWWSGARPLAVGIRVGALGAFLRYTSTETYFVSPGLSLEPALSLSLPAAPWLGLGISLPVVIDFRADLAFSGVASLVVNVGAKLRWPVSP